MSEEIEGSLATKYLVLKLSKPINLEKLLKDLKTFQIDRDKTCTWSDLAEILASAELDQKQTKLGEYIKDLG